MVTKNYDRDFQSLHSQDLNETHVAHVQLTQVWIKSVNKQLIFVLKNVNNQQSAVTFQKCQQSAVIFQKCQQTAVIFFS